ncbi:TRAP transporter small permease [Vibrio sp. A1-1]|uniref:TRAP transporter small permease n=1 Tax=Vibrio sp. A1-1 TaxID=2912250 RepID=UPI001F3E306C|nr:TRAP transporter small permease [Vibrio sp. A1-1]MCF7454302.1 TRAP transporter small permease [Vibrio sp. A1-1]
MNQTQTAPQSDTFSVFTFINKLLEKIETTILISGILLIMINSVSNAIGRYFFSKSLYFTEELNQFLIVFITFAGFSYAVRQGRNIRMTALYDPLSKSKKKCLMILISFCSGLLMAYLCYLSTMYVLDIKALNKVSPALIMPVYYVYIIIPVSLGIASLQYFGTTYVNVTHEEVYVSPLVVDKKEGEE